MAIFGTDALLLTHATEKIPYGDKAPWKDGTQQSVPGKSQYIDWSNADQWISWLDTAIDLSPQIGDLTISYTPQYVPWNRNLGQSRGANNVIKTGYELEVMVNMPYFDAGWDELNSFWPNTNTQNHDEVPAGTTVNHVIPQYYVDLVIIDGETYKQGNNWKVGLMFAGRWYCDTTGINMPVDGLQTYDIVLRPYMVEVHTQDFNATPVP